MTTMILSERVRRAIEKYPESRNTLAALSGVRASAISRFMAGKGMTTGNLDKLLPVLGLELSEVRKTKGR
jgi:transcriptional regulator with XRE-family HTH domain